MTIAIVSFLVGMVLGQRFGVLILVPATAVGLALAIGYALANGDRLLLVVQIGAATVASLEVGYLLGIGLRHLLVAGRASRSPGRSIPGSISPRRAAPTSV